MNRLFLFGLAGFLFASCDPCKNMDCVTSDSGIQLEFRSKSTNANLFFGDNAVYDPDSLRVIFLESTQWSFTPENNQERFVFNASEAHPFIVEYPGVFKDTVHINAISQQTECCGQIKDFTTIDYDGEVIEGKAGYLPSYVIRK